MAPSNSHLTLVEWQNQLSPERESDSQDHEESTEDESDNALKESKSQGDLQQPQAATSPLRPKQNLSVDIGRVPSADPSRRSSLEGVFARSAAALSSSTSTSIAATPSNDRARRFPFHHLPGEIRNRVYAYLVEYGLIDNSPTSVNLFQDRLRANSSDANHRPIDFIINGLSHVSRPMYVEFVSLLLPKKTFEVKLADDMVHFEAILDDLPLDKGWAKVHKLAFRKYSDVATSLSRAIEAMDFLKKFPNLYEVTFNVKLDHLHMPQTPAAGRQLAFLHGVPWTRTPEQIAANYHFAALTEMPSLRRVTVVCEWGGPIRRTPQTMTPFWDLQIWLANELKHAPGVQSIIPSLPFDDPREMGAWNIRIQR